jgi:hypothetical protein
MTMRRVWSVGVALLACSVLGCSTGGEGARSFTDAGISFRYPKSWHVTGFSTTNQPHRLTVTSYPVPTNAVEGDCGGHAAVEALPVDGILVLLIDYGERATFPPRPSRLTMQDGEFAEYECFGPSTMFRLRLGRRDLQAHVAFGEEAGEDAQQQALAVLAGLELSGQAQVDFIPDTRREGDDVVVPLTFPDGTTAELVYPLNLDLAALGVFPYASGRLQGKSPIAGRGDVVGRDFWIRRGDVEELLERRNGGRRPELLAQHEGADGATVGFWDLDADGTRKLGFQFGRWAVLVYDYVGAAAMTDAERASWAASFSGRETADGFLVLEASGPLRLARAGEHAGPQLTFSATDPRRELTLYPGPCRPHRDQQRVVAGKRVEWSGGFADWCLSESMRIHAGGTRRFIGALIGNLAVRSR